MANMLIVLAIIGFFALVLCGEEIIEIIRALRGK